MDSNNFNPNGMLIILDLWGCEFGILNHPSFLFYQAKLAAEQANMQVLAISIVPFKPQGLSLALILGESHLTIHTSPEYGYAAIDVFTCGKGNPLLAAKYLCDVLKPEEVSIKKIERGVKPLIGGEKLEMDSQLKEADHASR